MSRYIFDYNGKKIGEICSLGSKEVLLDINGRKLGEFDGRYTFDSYGRKIGEGNLLTSLIR